MIRVGVVAPVFIGDPNRTLEVARRAESAGLDGVFVNDHLLPLRDRNGPVLSALVMLGAMASALTRCAVGSLVLRIGNVPDVAVVQAAETLLCLAPDRVIFGLGLGDAMSNAEDRAFGMPRSPLAERRAALRKLCTTLRGMDPAPKVWVAGASPGAIEIASEAGGWNGWCVTPERVAEVAELVSASTMLTWAGRFSPTEGGHRSERTSWLHAERPEFVAAAAEGREVIGGINSVVKHLEELSASGASWAIYDTPVDAWRNDAIEELGEAALRYRAVRNDL